MLFVIWNKISQGPNLETLWATGKSQVCLSPRRRVVYLDLSSSKALRSHRSRAELYSSVSLSLLPCCQNTDCTWVTWGGCTHPSFFYHICFFLPQSEVRWSCRQLRPKNCPPPQCPVRCSAPLAPFLKAGGPFWWDVCLQWRRKGIDSNLSLEIDIFKTVRFIRRGFSAFRPISPRPRCLHRAQLGPLVFCNGIWAKAPASHKVLFCFTLYNNTYIIKIYNIK